ncbi:MAG: helix-hairpin-helix domain-containing protein, partial [Polyangiales bacterium]
MDDVPEKHALVPLEEEKRLAREARDAEGRLRQESAQALELRGRVELVRYSQGGFTVGRVKTAEGVVHTFAGKCVVMAGDPVVFTGIWGTHPKFGLQFEVKRSAFDGDLSEEGLANYLAGHPEARGIGPKKALAIAAAFKGRFEETIENDPGEIARVAGIQLAVVEKLRAVWLKGKDEVRCRLFLASLDISPETSDAIVRAYTRSGLSGASIKTLIESDPFALSRDVRGFGFTRADAIARKVGLDPEHPTRIAAGIEHAVSKQLDDGHTWTAYPDLVTAANNLLTIDREKVDAIVDAMPGPHADARQMTDGLKKAVEDERVLRMLDGFRRRPSLVGRATDTYGTMGLARPDVYEKELAVGRRFYQLGPSPFFSEEEAERIAREAEGEGLNLGQRRA